MAIRPLYSIAQPEITIAADAVQSFDLAVNPLSVVLLNIRPLNDTTTQANYASYKTICQAFNRVSILYLGQSIYSMRGEDIAALNFLRYGLVPWEMNPAITDNVRRCVTLPLMLGKSAFDDVSCFPATRRGELVVEIDFDVADTGYDNFNFDIATIELLGANPKQYEKKVTINQTMAVGTNDIDLYAGNTCRGVLAFGTTGFTGATPAPTLGRLRTILDNVEVGYANIDWEVAGMLPSLWGRAAPVASSHVHSYDGAAAGISQTQTANNIDSDFTNYVYLDFDPTGDDAFVLDTRGSSRFQIRAEAEAANAARVIQVEVIKS